MSANILRSLSHMDGQPMHQSQLRGAGDASSPRSTPVFDSNISPLQVFVQAKKNINDIFVDVEVYLQETVQFVDGKSNGNEQ